MSDPIPPPPAQDPDRARLLATYQGLRDRLAAAYQGSGDDIDTISAIMHELREEYLARLPVVPVSRNPLTGEAVSHSLDLMGIDGLWWDYEAAIRPFEPVDGPVVGFTGAMQLAEEVEHTSFLVKPGPGAPFVIPGVLQTDGVVATLSSLAVGRHQGYLILYFTPGPIPTERPNDWGRNRYEVTKPDGTPGWGETDEWEGDYDFELASWIERGKLFWIAPGDSRLTLHEEVPDCPYLGLEGVREIQRVQEGEVWYPGMVEG